MKALAKLEKKAGIWLADVAKPKIKANEILVKINRTGICGTDLHIYEWDEWSQANVPVPMVIGHEFSGVVCEIGELVSGFNIGDRVSGESHLTCGHCRNCRAGQQHLCRSTKGIGVNHQGAFAEYMALPASHAFRLVEPITNALGAILDPFGNAVHTALSFDLVGEDVLITGAGPIGIMAAAVAKHVGARYVVVTDVNDYRLGLAKKMGATRAVNVHESNLNEVMDELGMLEGFDVAMEMSGSPDALNTLLEVMNHGGHIALLGILPGTAAIDWSQVIFKGLEIRGIYGREMYDTWYKMQSMLQSGLDIMPVITHEFHVSNFQQAFDVMLSGESGKVVLSWE